MQRPRAILFDWDNTLVDSWAVIHEALVVTFEAMGHVPWTLEETQQRVRHSLRDAFPPLFGERWEEARKLYLDAFTAVHLQRLTALAGAAAMLEAVAEDGYYLAVVSNKTGRLLRREAEHLGWSRHFRAMVGAGDARADKPDPAVVEAAFRGAASTPPRPGWWATRPSTSNVPSPRAVSRCWSRQRISRRSPLELSQRYVFRIALLCFRV
jgi:phosphoglycolate phosphatase